MISSWFLVTRGLWLIFLELTVMQLAYNFDASARYPVFLLVLWVLGACMIILAALVWLPLPVLAGLSVATIVLHHLLDGINALERRIMSDMESSDLVVLSRFRSVPDAQIAKGILDGAEIESMIRSDNAGGMYPALAEAELLVRAADVDKAGTVLAAGEQAE